MRPNVNLFLGDSLTHLKGLPDNKIRLFLQDLPYGITRNPWDKPVDLSAYWPEWHRVGMDNAALLFFATQKFASKLIESNENEFRYDIVWEKSNASGHLNAKKMPLRAHELILVFYRTLPAYNPQKTQGHARKVSTAKHKRNSKKSTNYGTYGDVGYDSTERYPRSVIRFASDKQVSALHPTQKPVELLRYLVRTYSEEYDTVYDGFMGSGSTAEACILERRHFIGADITEAYYNIAFSRTLAN